MIALKACVVALPTVAESRCGVEMAIDRWQDVAGLQGARPAVPREPAGPRQCGALIGMPPAVLRSGAGVSKR